ncbi:DUF1015 family protein [Nocardioides sp.]|uniref:DUF1015 family protein n=1 Tax=Nocardioides sp. TaxID=35761 RepID=UPI003529BF2A
MSQDGPVRPLDGRVVRQDHATRTVRAMTESQDDSGVDLYQVAVDLAAYDDPPPALYVYRQTLGDATYTGVVCDVAVRAIAEGQVRGHEAVERLRVEALIWHHSRTHGPPALVKLLHVAGPAYSRCLAEAQQAEPLLDFDGPNGLRQTVWRLPDGPEARAVAEEMGRATLYIADGHHRAAAALETWRSEGEPAEAGLWCLIYPLDALSLSAFHRRASGPLEPGRLVALLGEHFDLTKAEAPPTPALGRVGVYLDGQWYDARLTSERPAGVAGLDVTLLQRLVLDRLDPAPPGRVRTVETHPEATPLAELLARCDNDHGALFTLAAPSAATVIEVADAGEVMPPKATYFQPKPAAGIFLRR